MIARPSITPDDAGCQTLIAQRLRQKGFRYEDLSRKGVSNSWLLHSGKNATDGPLLVFAGHTDVVPPGDESQWRSHPFTAFEENGLLYGRGAADMKASVAAMVVAGERFVAQHLNIPAVWPCC